MRFVDAFVDGLDLIEVGFSDVEPKPTGRPGIAPGDLLKGAEHRGVPEGDGALR